MKKPLFICFFLLSSMISAKSQILISLLLGDKLNNPNLEFGIDGGLNIMSLQGVEGSTSKTGFNLGFYFDIKTKHKWILHTGIIVKSPMGAAGITPYPLNNPDLDNAFAGGEVKRNLRYFNLPVIIKRPFKNQFYVEGGLQFGLLAKAYDEFTQKIDKPKDLNYKLYNRSDYHPLDAGLVAGVGYRLMKGNGMNLGVRYYYGLVDITLADPDVYNRSLYLAVGIPIGAGKAKSKE